MNWEREQIIDRRKICIKNGKMNVIPIYLASWKKKITCYLDTWLLGGKLNLLLGYSIIWRKKLKITYYLVIILFERNKNWFTTWLFNHFEMYILFLGYLAILIKERKLANWLLWYLDKKQIDNLLVGYSVS